MIESQMHRLASRLGVRDGEAYTIVVGLVMALVLAVVGLPGVFRGFDPAALGQAAASAPSTTAPATVDGVDQPPSSGAVTPSLPAFAPAPSSSPVGNDAPSFGPSTPSMPPTATGSERPLGDLALLTTVAEPGSLDGVAVGPDGTVYVVSDDAGDEASMLWAFTETGKPVDSWAAPGQPKGRTRGLTGVAVDPDGTVWVVDASTASLLRLDRTAGELVPVVEVDDIPACGILNLASPCESGLLDSAPLLSGIAAAPDGSIVIADRAQGVVWQLAGRKLTVLAALDDRVAADGPVGLSFLSDDELIVAVGGRLSSFPPGLPAVLQIRLVDGAAQPPVVVADLAVTETPGDVVAGDSGRIYVSIPSAGIIADIGVDQGDRIDIVGESFDPAFTTPTGLALRERSLLLTDRSTRLFDLAINDRPAN